jgi:hypothetical protein
MSNRSASASTPSHKEVVSPVNLGDLNEASLSASGFLSPTQSSQAGFDGTSTGARSHPASTVGGDPTNVRVMVRVRPFNNTEIGLSAAQRAASSDSAGLNTLEPILHCSADHVITVLDHTANFASKEAFKFDEVFWSVPSAQYADTDPGVRIATQEDVYTSVGIPAVDAVLSGRNSCIFAYGQTGSGKTHTMMGYPGDAGIIPRIVKRLFDLVAESPPHLDHSVTASFMEIYNEKVRDLLDAAAIKAHARDGNFCDRKVRYNPETGAYVEGLRRTAISSAAECDDVIVAGTTYRTTASTKMNDTSSRSHAILQLHVKKTDRHSGFARHAVLNLVDLAGSERIRMSGVSGTALTEAKNINLSLTTLRRVIDTLLENASKSHRAKPSVVPYRESMLTWVLSESLGGNCQTVMLGMMSPHERNMEDTVNTLRYCLRAKAITCHVRVNEEKCKVVMGALKAEMESMRKQQEEAVEKARQDAEERERLRAEEETAKKQADAQRKQQSMASAKAQAMLAKHTAALKRVHSMLEAKTLMADESQKFEAERVETLLLSDTQRQSIAEEREKIRESEAAMREAELEIALHESARFETGEREKEAQLRRQQEIQREMGNIFRLATRFGCDNAQMAALRDENAKVTEEIERYELMLQRGSRRRQLTKAAIATIKEHDEAAQQREREVTRATAAAVDAKTRRMRDLKIAADKLTQEIKDATDALAATKHDVEAAYRQLEATNAECRANVKVAGRRATTAQAKLFAVDLELQRVELLKSLADNDAHDARKRRDAAAATVAKLVDRDAAVAAEMAFVQGDIHVLHQDVGASDGDAAAAGNEVLHVQRRLEIERRVRSRILSIENDLLRYLASRRSELPASIIKRLEQRKIAPLLPASEDDPQMVAELQRLMAELAGSPRLGEESPPRAGLRSTSMGEW